MRRPGWLCMLVVTTACGRLGFDPTGDGGPGDGARDGDTDSTIDAAPSLCAGAGVRLCDGFEAPALDARWMLDNEQGTSTVSSVRAYRGTSSLYVQTDQITTPTQFPRAELRTYESLPVTGTLHVRAFVYLTAPTVPSFVQLLNFANGAGVGISMGVRNGFVVNNDYTAINYAESTTVRFPTDRWVCVGFEVPSGTTDTIRVYIDEVEVTDVAIPKATPQPQPTHIYVGIDWPNMYSSLPPSEAWIDELIIDDAPTNCDQ